MHRHTLAKLIHTKLNIKNKTKTKRVVMVHTFNPQHLVGRQRQVDLWEFQANLVYRVSSATAKATEKPCLEKPKQQNKTKKKPRVSLYSSVYPGTPYVAQVG